MAADSRPKRVRAEGDDNPRVTKHTKTSHDNDEGKTSLTLDGLRDAVHVTEEACEGLYELEMEHLSVLREIDKLREKIACLHEREDRLDSDIFQEEKRLEKTLLIPSRLVPAAKRIAAGKPTLVSLASLLDAKMKDGCTAMELLASIPHHVFTFPLVRYEEFGGFKGREMVDWHRPLSNAPNGKEHVGHQNKVRTLEKFYCLLGEGERNGCFRQHVDTWLRGDIAVPPEGTTETDWRSFQMLCGMFVWGVCVGGIELNDDVNKGVDEGLMRQVHAYFRRRAKLPEDNAELPENTIMSVFQSKTHNTFRDYGDPYTMPQEDVRDDIYGDRVGGAKTDRHALYNARFVVFHPLK